MSESGASRGGQASWEPISSAPWIKSFTPTLRRPFRSMADRGASSSALMEYQPSVSQTTAAGDSGFGRAGSAASSDLTGLCSRLAIPHTQSTMVLAGVSSLSVIFFRADLRLWSTSTSYLKRINDFPITPIFPHLISKTWKAEQLLSNFQVKDLYQSVHLAGNLELKRRDCTRQHTNDIHV